MLLWVVRQPAALRISAPGQAAASRGIVATIMMGDSTLLPFTAGQLIRGGCATELTRETGPLVL